MVEGESLYADPVFGPRARLYPVSETLFRTEDDVEATRVFATDDAGTMVFTGGFAYAERVPRWRVEIVRWPVMLSFFLAATPLAMLIPWLVRIRRAEPSGFWWLKTSLLLCAAAVLLPTAGVMNVRDIELGARNLWTGAMFIGSVMLPVSALLALFFTVNAWREDAGPWLRTLRPRRFRRRAGALRLHVVVGHDRLQAVELLVSRPRYFAVAKPTMRPTIEPGRMISQK